MIVMVLEVLTSCSDVDDEVRDKWLLYCLWTAVYKSKAGIVLESLGLKSGESGSNPNPRSKQPLSSSISSFVMQLLVRRRRSDGCLFFIRSQASVRFTSGGKESCFIRGFGGCGVLLFDIVVARFFLFAFGFVRTTSYKAI